MVSDKKNETSITTIKISVQETPESDSDKDGMPNIWERDHGLNPNDPTDANEDLDNDGKTNLEEYMNDTDPTIKDDKDDGLTYSVDLFGTIIAIIIVFIFIIIFLFVIKPRIGKKVMKEELEKGRPEMRLPYETHPDLQDLRQPPQIKPRVLYKHQTPFPKVRSKSPSKTPVPKVEGQPSTIIPIPQKVVEPAVSQPDTLEMEE